LITSRIGEPQAGNASFTFGRFIHLSMDFFPGSMPCPGRLLPSFQDTSKLYSARKTLSATQYSLSLSQGLSGLGSLVRLIASHQLGSPNAVSSTLGKPTAG
jgi:hypothetical protein